MCESVRVEGVWGRLPVYTGGPHGDSLITGLDTFPLAEHTLGDYTAGDVLVFSHHAVITK